MSLVEETQREGRGVVRKKTERKVTRVYLKPLWKDILYIKKG